MFRLLGKRVDSDPSPSVKNKPVAPYGGPRCPFYGFIGGNGVFMENYGNACALTCSHTPCAMEMACSAPDWDKCSTFNHPKNISKLEHIMENVIMNPKAFWPAGQTKWEGIEVKIWFRHVMGRNFP